MVLVINQKESRDASTPKQPLDETKETRRFIVISPKDNRPVFNCIECVSLKNVVHYPDVEIKATLPLFSVDSIARPGQIYTLRKNLEGINVLGVLSTNEKDTEIKRKIIIGLNMYLPRNPLTP